MPDELDRDRNGNEVVRVRQNDTGHHLTVTADWAKEFSDGYTVLKQPAVDASGEHLPPKYKTTVSTEAAQKKAASTAVKEN